MRMNTNLCGESLSLFFQEGVSHYIPQTSCMGPDNLKADLRWFINRMFKSLEPVQLNNLKTFWYVGFGVGEYKSTLSGTQRVVITPPKYLLFETNKICTLNSLSELSSRNRKEVLMIACFAHQMALCSKFVAGMFKSKQGLISFMITRKPWIIHHQSVGSALY